MSLGMDIRGPVTDMRCSRDRACGALWVVHAQLKPMLATIIEGAGGVRVALKIYFTRHSLGTNRGRPRPPGLEFEQQEEHEGFGVTEEEECQGIRDEPSEKQVCRPESAHGHFESRNAGLGYVLGTSAIRPLQPRLAMDPLNDCGVSRRPCIKLACMHDNNSPHFYFPTHHDDTSK